MQGLHWDSVALASYQDPADTASSDTEPAQHHAEIQKYAEPHGASLV
jgi:hypothetical protein